MLPYQLIVASGAGGPTFAALDLETHAFRVLRPGDEVGFGEGPAFTLGLLWMRDGCGCGGLCDSREPCPMRYNAKPSMVFCARGIDYDPLAWVGRPMFVTGGVPALPARGLGQSGRAPSADSSRVRPGGTAP